MFYKFLRRSITWLYKQTDQCVQLPFVLISEWQIMDIISAKAEETPLTINKPLNLSKLRVFGFVGGSSDDNEYCFSNHFFSRSLRVPSSLILAIWLDISFAKGEPFWKI